jgi:Zn-dependent protease/CBS domain-containing protein
MGWAPRVGSLFGIEIRIHVTFLVLLAFLWMAHWLPERSIGAALTGVTFFMLIFLCVVLHELGHALAARRFGIQTRDITLLPIGGVARLERMPEKPAQELWVAIAGPLVNVAIATGLFLGLTLTSSWQPLEVMALTKGNLAERLYYANLSLVVFNLLPAFPMDGGRVLRAFLAMSMPYVQATWIAARIGQGMALLFGFAGLLLPQPMLILIAFFVWAGAEQEAASAQMKSSFAGVPVREAMLVQFQVLYPTESLGGVARRMLAGTQKDFPVVNGMGQVLGILTHSGFFDALAHHGDEAPVTVAMTEDFDTAEASESMESVLNRARPESCTTMPVLRDGALIGLLTAENVGEFIMIQAARKRFG